MSAKHSPGPWDVTLEKDRATIQNIDRHVCAVEIYGDDTEGLANARLIQKSDYMYELLQRIWESAQFAFEANPMPAVENLRQISNEIGDLLDWVDTGGE